MDPYGGFGEQWEAGSSEDEQMTYHPANCLQGTQHPMSHMHTFARDRTLTSCPPAFHLLFMLQRNSALLDKVLEEPVVAQVLCGSWSCASIFLCMGYKCVLSHTSSSILTTRLTVELWIGADCGPVVCSGGACDGSASRRPSPRRRLCQPHEHVAPKAHKQACAFRWPFWRPLPGSVVPAST